MTSCPVAQQGEAGSMILSSRKDLLSNCYVPDTILGPGITEGDKRDSPLAMYLLEQVTENGQHV